MLEFYKNKKVLVTGHTGFKGSWLCKILSIAGADVIGVSLEPESDISLYNILKLDNEIKSVISDIRNLDELRKVFIENKPEIVFHLAAQPLVRESYENPVYTYETNVMGTVNLLECIRNCKSVKSVLNITTDKVYNNNEWDWPYREIDELNGFDPYSNSKSCSELVTSSYKRAFFDNNREISISTARAGNVIGGGDFSKDRILPDCIKAAINDDDIIVRNPSSIRPYQHVFEALSAYLMIAQKQYNNKSFEGSYNIGPDEYGCVKTREISIRPYQHVFEALSAYLMIAQKQYNNKSFEGSYNIGPDEYGCVKTREIVDLFCQLWGNVNWKQKNEDNNLHESNILKLDCSKIKNTIGWTPRLTIDEAIKLTVDWSKEYYSSKNINEISEKQILEYFI